MTKKLVLHLPHASTHIPFYDGYLVPHDALENEMLKLTDWYTDELFDSEDDDKITAPFSRIFCDVERFTDDAQEVMSQYGMGVLYEKNDEGFEMRKVTPELREKVLETYYWKHHERLSTAVAHQLRNFGKALIVDCHSYPSTPLKRCLDQSGQRPDFNIGTDPFHTPQQLIDVSVAFFEKAGYSLGVDWPYKGALVPLAYYQQDKNVMSIMLEINRGLYLNEPSNEKSIRFDEIKNVVQDYLKTLKSYI